MQSTKMSFIVPSYINVWPQSPGTAVAMRANALQLRRLNKMQFASGQCKTQTADCRLETSDKG